jgi:hypothetical protein
MSFGNADSLPNGTIVEVGAAYLLKWRGWFYKWSFVEYGEPLRAASLPGVVRNVTPASIVRMYQGGFTPQVHPSAYR